MPHYAVNVNHHKGLLNIMKCEFSGNIIFTWGSQVETGNSILLLRITAF